MRRQIVWILTVWVVTLHAQTPPATSGVGKNREEAIRAARERNELGVQYLRQGKYAEAEPLLTQAAELYQSTSGDSDLALATTLNNLGASYAGLGRFADQETAYLRAASIYEKALGSNHPNYAIALHDWESLIWNGDASRKRSASSNGRWQSGRRPSGRPIRRYS